LIYENIMKLCQERQIRVSRLEKELGIGNATIRGWATSSPRIDLLKKVADFFGVTIDDLVSDAPVTEYQKSRPEKRTRSEKGD